MAAAILLLIASVPVRARRESATLNLSEQSFGFYEWEGDAATGRMRWTSPSAGFFVPAHTSEVEIPLRAAFSERRPKADRRQHRDRRPGVPPARIDERRLVHAPAAPAGGSRVLGVQLGEVTTR